jgi:putative peptidoglycan lipid II flippase
MTNTYPCWIDTILLNYPAQVLPAGLAIVENSIEEKVRPFAGHGQFLARSTMLLVITTVISRLLGVVREIMIAKLYGATGYTDAFFFAYNIPELVRTLLISGALSSVFIPIFTEFARKEGEAYAKKMSGQVFGFVLLISVGVALLGVVLAPLIVQFAQLIGLRAVSPEKYELTVKLTRMIFPILIFIALSGLCQGIFNSLGNFRTPAFAPFFFNIVIIGLLVSEDFISDPARIQMAAIAFVIGAAAQLLYQMPRLRKDGIKITMHIDFRDPVYGKFLMLAPAAMLGYATMVVNSFVDKSIAYALAPASLSALTYGFRVQQLPFSVFGVSVATALFPSISRYLTEGRMDEFRRATSAGIRLLIFTLVPAMVVFLSLKDGIVQLLFQRGEFDAAATADAAAALKWYTLGIVPASLLLLVSRVFFAGQDMKTPLKAGIMMIVLNFGLDIWSSQPWGLDMGFEGIALTTSIVAFLNLGILVFILDGRYGGFVRMFFNRHVAKILFAGFWQYVCSQLSYIFLIDRIRQLDLGSEFLNVLAAALIAIVLSLALYSALVVVMRVGELKMIKEYLFKRSHV